MIYPGNFEIKIGFDQIRELAKSYCLFEPGRILIDSDKLITDPEALNLKLDQTEEFRFILSEGIDFPIDHFIDISALLSKARVEGAFLEEYEVFNLQRALSSVKAILSFLKNDDRNRFPAIKIMASEVKIFPMVTERINNLLNKNGKIKDNASKELQDIRRELLSKQSAISKRLNAILRKAQSEGWVDEDATLAIRNGRPVIPVPASNKRRIAGYIHDESGTGKTAYVEPAEIVEASNELRELEMAERREIIKILIIFTDYIRPYIDELIVAHSFLAEIDACRARAKLAYSLNAIRPPLVRETEISWEQAVHPLLLLSFRETGREKDVVPLDIWLNKQNRILLISGPNAGGKSVCLKTLGLLQYMFQCGYLVPVKESSKFGIFEKFFIDIGDEQSLENDLSTYSSHLTNMKFFLRYADSTSLVLIDEFGSGTEPMLGGAIAEAVLEYLNRSGSFGLITTHYTNLKHFAASADGIINGAMLFDTEKIQPVFKLAIGRPGSSFAFEIARKIGLPEEILQKAKERAGQDHIEFDKHLRDIIRDKKYWENKRDRIRVSEKRLGGLVEEYDKELRDSEKLRKKILEDAKNKASEILAGANKQIENTIREIRESEADKLRTREARQKLEEFRESVDKIGEEKDELRSKLEELKKREENLQQRRPSLRKKAVPRESTDREIKKGDYVMMSGQDTPGQVLKLSGKKFLVAFGNIQTSVKAELLSKITAEKYKSLTRSSGSVNQLGDWNPGLRRLSFRPDIDLRGKRADDALQLLSEFIDEAIMVQSRELRILHGKGNGILRELIRQQLKANKVVEYFGDEHVERGGAGITLVRLDI
ncbi:MAG: Smr/MutS family protein [Bacteroidales bacterium]|nr:Smr/MutS family protein [Bacteroidales bacterium]